MSPIDLQPVLDGNTIKLRPLKRKDFEALCLAASDPKIWELHPDSERYKRDIFQQRFFEGALTSRGALVIEESDSGRIIGSSRYYEWNPDAKEISIGYTFIERSHWGNGTNRELKELMLNHIFNGLALCGFMSARPICARVVVSKSLGQLYLMKKEENSTASRLSSCITNWKRRNLSRAPIKMRCEVWKE